MKALQHLLQRLGDFADRCRVSRWFGAGFWVTMLKQDVAEVAKVENRAAAMAHQNECAEIEVERELGELVATASAPLAAELRQAIRTLHRCERRNHKIGEALTD